MGFGVILEFVKETISGIIAGFTTGDFAIWLSFAIGCGIVIGAGIGGMIEYRSGKLNE
jgi:hypothetical protein